MKVILEMSVRSRSSADVASAWTSGRSSGFSGQTNLYEGTVSNQPSALVSVAAPYKAAQTLPLISGVNSGIWGSQNDSILGRRMQDHMGVAVDGVNYIIANLGDGPGLGIFKQDASGKWAQAIAIPNTDHFSTSDMKLREDGQALLVTYCNQQSQVIYSSYIVDATTGNWMLWNSTVVNQTSEHGVDNPTIAVSPAGQLWVSYTDTTSAGLRFHLSISSDRGRTWAAQDATIVGATSGSARAVATDDRTGVLYTTDSAMMWLTYDSTAGWTQRTVMSSKTPGHFGSHFDTTTIGNDMYVATPDDAGHLIFASYDGETGIWNAPVRLTGDDRDVTNVQLAASDTGYLYLVYDDAAHSALKVAISRDGGATWTGAANLMFPVTIADPVTRFEAPSHFSGDLKVMLQINSPSASWVEGLLEYDLHLDPSTGRVLSAAASQGATVQTGASAFGFEDIAAAGGGFADDAANSTGQGGAAPAGSGAAVVSSSIEAALGLYGELGPHAATGT